MSARRHDYDEVNRIVRDAAAAGLPLVATLAAELDIGESTASGVLQKARQLDPSLPASTTHRGPLPPNPVRERVFHESLPEGVALDDIAALYREAVVAGRRGVRTVAERHGVDEAVVVEWVILAVEARLMAMPVTIVATGTEVH